MSKQYSLDQLTTWLGTFIPYPLEDADEDQLEAAAKAQALLYLLAHSYTLKQGQKMEDVHVFSPRERDTIIAALRLWQDRNEFQSGGRTAYLTDIATNDGQHEPLDENEIDILIEEKLQ